MSDHPERFHQLGEVVLFGAKGFPESPRPFVIEEVTEYGGRMFLKFQGVDSISEAEQLRGAEVRIPMRERMLLPSDEYYQSDLIGCTVVDHESGDLLGLITGWLDQGGSGLLQVEAAGSGTELLIPFVESICVDVDLDQKKISVNLPEGLKELNK